MYQSFVIREVGDVTIVKISISDLSSSRCMLMLHVGCCIMLQMHEVRRSQIYLLVNHPGQAGELNELGNASSSLSHFDVRRRSHNQKTKMSSNNVGTTVDGNISAPLPTKLPGIKEVKGGSPQCVESLGIDSMIILNSNHEKKHLSNHKFALYVLHVVRDHYNQFGKSVTKTAIEAALLKIYQRKRKQKEKMMTDRNKDANTNLAVLSSECPTTAKASARQSSQSLQTPLKSNDTSDHSKKPQVERVVSNASSEGMHQHVSTSRVRLSIGVMVQKGLHELEYRGYIEVEHGADCYSTRNKNKTKNETMVSLTFDGIFALFNYEGDRQKQKRIMFSKEGPTNSDIQMAIRSKLKDHQNHIIALIFDRRRHSRKAIFRQLNEMIEGHPKQQQQQQQQQPAKHLNKAGTIRSTVPYSQPFPSKPLSMNAKKPSNFSSNISWARFTRDLTFLRKMGIIDYPSHTEIQMTDYLFPFGPPEGF